MDGETVKKLLVTNNIDLNNVKYFENNQTYPISEIPAVHVKRCLLEKKLSEKYGKNVSNYIMSQTYPNNKSPNVDPTAILRFITDTAL